jgi:hypothetical protein
MKMNAAEAESFFNPHIKEEQEDDPSTKKECLLCSVSKPSAEFSNTQWKKETPKCSACLLPIQAPGEKPKIRVKDGTKTKTLTRSMLAAEAKELSQAELEKALGTLKLSLAAVQRKRAANDLRGNTRTLYEEGLNKEQKVFLCFMR